jgi:hypothetical protein
MDAVGLGKRYLISTDREGAISPEGVRKFLGGLGLYRELSLKRKSGGRSGDFGAEIMLYELFASGSEAGWTRGAVHVYVVTDDTCNGYAQCWSVLIDLPPDDNRIRETILEYLDERDFSNKYWSFRERPLGFKRYGSFMDSVPDLSSVFAVPPP